MRRAGAPLCAQSGFVNGWRSPRSPQLELLSDEEELARSVLEVDVDRSCIEHDQSGPYGVRAGRGGVDARFL